MLAGNPYVTFGEELLAERQAAKELILSLILFIPAKLSSATKLFKDSLAKRARTSLLNHLFAAIMDTIFLLGRLFTSITIARLSTAQRLS